MNRLTLFMTLLSLSSLWGSSKESSPTVEDALEAVELAIAKNPEARRIHFTRFFHQSCELHKELAAQFAKDHPKLWKTALSSSGNRHNPKVLPLHAKFPETLRKTPTVQKIEARLNQAGYTLGRIEFEKFALDQKNDRISSYSIVYALPFSKTENPKTQSKPPLQIPQASLCFLCSLCGQIPLNQASAPFRSFCGQKPPTTFRPFRNFRGSKSLPKKAPSILQQPPHHPFRIP